VSREKKRQPKQWQDLKNREREAVREQFLSQLLQKVSSPEAREWQQKFEKAKASLEIVLNAVFKEKVTNDPKEIMSIYQDLKGKGP
jgi:hypothetical protein